MIEIEESKIGRMSSLVKNMMSCGKQLISCLDEFSQDDERDDDEDYDDDGYESRESMRRSRRGRMDSYSRKGSRY